MKLSVIIPVYNAVGTICRSLDSIYAQGLDPREFEVICVDDCSTDSSVDVLNRYLYEGVHPDNLKVIRHPVNTRQGGVETQVSERLKASGYFISTATTSLWKAA